MRIPLLAPVVLALLALGACSSGDDPEGDAPASTTPGTTTTAAAEASPAVVADSGAGSTTYCTKVTGPDDYVWSGTQFTAKADATLDHAGPASLGGVRVVGSWIVEDARDDGFFGTWDDDANPAQGHDPVRAAGASLSAGTTYRLVLRLRPSATGSGQVEGFDVAWTADGTPGSLTDDSVLQFARHCG